MNKLSDYVLRHILQFVTDHDLMGGVRVNKSFNSIIKEDGRYNIECLCHRKYIEMDEELFKIYNDKLDIIKRKNGECQYFVIDTSRQRTSLESIVGIINDNSSLFIDCALEFSWPIDEYGKITITTTDISQIIDHKYLVKPFRLHICNVDVCVISLWRYPYITKFWNILPLHCWYNFDSLDASEKIYKQFVRNHQKIVGKNVIHMIDRIFDRLNWYREPEVTKSICSPEERIPTVLDPSRQMLTEQFNKLVELRKMRG